MGRACRPKSAAQVGARGERLDESVPGSGLGLAIVRDISKLYGGFFALEASPLGGLLARLELPGDPIKTQKKQGINDGTPNVGRRSGEAA